MKKELAKIFACRQCGHCCHGETTVSLTPDDLARMVAYLRLSEAEVRQRYLRETDGVIQMRIVEGHCIFYKEGCTIHPGKPWRCTEWPLHPSILTDPNNFTAIRDSCPGIKRDVSYEEFCRVLRKLIEARK